MLYHSELIACALGCGGSSNTAESLGGGGSSPAESLGGSGSSTAESLLVEAGFYARDETLSPAFRAATNWAATPRRFDFAMDGASGEVVSERNAAGWWKVRLDGESKLRSAHTRQLSVLVPPSEDSDDNRSGCI